MNDTLTFLYCLIPVCKQETKRYTVNQRKQLTLFNDRHSPDLTGAEKRGHEKGMEVDMNIKTAKATES